MENPHPMKICDIVQFYSDLSGGVKRYIDDKIRTFAARSDIEHVVIVPGRRNTVRCEGNTRIYEVRSLRVLGSSSYRLLCSPRRIRQIIFIEKPDLIEVGDPYHTAWISRRIARQFDIPIIAYYHSDYPRAFGRTLEKYYGKTIGKITESLITRYLSRLYNHMSATVVATPVFEQILQGIGINNIFQVPLGTDTEQFRPVDTHAQVLHDLNLDPDTRLLLYIGRLAREKNVIHLVNMMDLFPPQEKIALLLVGDGEQRQLIKTMTRRTPRVFLHPYCSRPDLLSVFYSAADAFVHPGTNETFGLVSLEAQACGTPVVVVCGGGVDHTLNCEPAPVFASGASPLQLKTAVSERLSHRETAGDRASRRERIIRHFGKETTCGLMVDLYELIVSEHRQCPETISSPRQRVRR